MYTSLIEFFFREKTDMNRRLVHPIDDDDDDDDDGGVFPENVIPPMTPVASSPLDYDIVGYFRNFFYNIATFVLIPLKLARLLVELFFWFLTIIYPFLFYLLIIWFFWYLLIIYWPYVMQVILVVGIPIANVLIILFNLFFMVAVIILMIIITVWNAFVPFLGMILYVVINVISTILADVYNAIGSIDWEPIVAGFMQILNIIVQIAVQILVVLIKVGSEILLALAKIIGPILKILLTFVKILLPILAWILKLLYYILSPILQILAAFFGGGDPSGSRMKPESSTTTGRRLFSLGLAPIVLNKTTYMPFYNEQPNVEKMPATIPEGLTPDEKDEFERFLKSIGEMEMEPTDNDFFSDTIREGLEIPVFSRPPTVDQEFDTNRRLFAWKPSTKNTLKFIDPVEEEEQAEAQDEPHLDNVAHTVARHMYTGARDISSTDMTLAMDTMNAIMREHRRQGDLSIQSILNDFSHRSKHMEPVFEDTVASVHYDEVVEHPEKMYQRFHNEMKYNRQPQFDRSGRKLLENWHDVSKEKMTGLRIEHARAVLEQQRKYKAYQENHLKVVTVVYASVTKSLKKTFEEGITPSNVMKNWESMLRSFGYKSIQEVRAHFENTHGDAVGFINSFSRVSELPILRYFKRADQTRVESPYFHDWAIEQQKLNKDKEKMHSRRLMQMQYNQDKDVRGDGQSKGALSGFATLSSRDCFSNPKNSLCIPNIPPNFSIRIPTIKLTKKQVQGMLQDVSRCHPWKLTYCLICWDRFYNAWQSFRWLLSTMPFINYPIATLTMRMPWTGVFLNWIF